MPRANRYWVPGAAYHLTHRCHDRAFLLRFARDRDAYRGLLREGLARSEVSLLTYAVTSNHVHLLVTSSSAHRIADLVQVVHGRFAEAYNRRKGRQGAFWSDRYHATQIDSGAYLMACLRYIDLNMVRAGVVTHPSQWPWTGWHELADAERKRARLVDRDALLARFEGTAWSAWQQHYRQYVDDAIHAGNMPRDARWTDAVAVGSASFVSRVEAQLLATDQRRRLERAEASDHSWILHEPPTSTGSWAENDIKNSPIRPEIGRFWA